MACRSFLAPAHARSCWAACSSGPAGNGIAFAGICPQMPPRTRFHKHFAGGQFRAWQQRQAAVPAPDAAAPPPPAPLAAAPLPDATVRPSAQFQEIMEMVMIGHMSCATANRIAVGQAADAKAIGYPMHPEMKMLAEIGTKGKEKSHLWRDLETKLQLKVCNFPEPLYCPLPVLDRKPVFDRADFTQGLCGPRCLRRHGLQRPSRHKGNATFDAAVQTYNARQSTSAQSHLD